MALQAILDEARARREAAAAEAREREAQALERIRTVAMSVLSEAELLELNASFDSDGRFPVVKLIYRGSVRTFGERDLNRNSIVVWIDGVEAQYSANDKSMMEFKSRLIKLLSRRDIRRAELNEAIKQSSSMGFDSDKDVVNAISKATNVVNEYEDEIAEQVMARHEAEVADLLSRIAAIDASGPSPWVYLNSIKAILSDAIFDQRVQAALNNKSTEISDYEQQVQLSDQERERQRIDAEKAEFKPFIYFVIRFGLSNGEAHEIGAITSLRPAPTNGWYTSVNGEVVSLTQVISIRMVRVTDYRDLPVWCPTNQTDFGRIRITPADAWLISNIPVCEHCGAQMEPSPAGVWACPTPDCPGF